MEPRIISATELAKEELFYKKLADLSEELQIEKIDCQLWNDLNSPFLIINGDTFDKSKKVSERVANIYYDIFTETNIK